MIPLSRNGKVARLPKPIREELNRRLDQGASGGPLLQWLNSLPEVHAVLAADFGGRPINKQSLSQWRHGGYAEWLRLRETRVLAGQILAEARELQPAGRPPLTDQVSSWVLIRYLMVVRKLIGQTGAGKADFQLLRQFSRDLMAFQRGDHAKARLQFEWVRFKLLSGLQPASAAPCPEPPKTEAVVTDAKPSSADWQSAVSPVAKPACHGHAQPLSNNPATPFYSAGLCHPAPLPSASVRPSQTFEIFNKSVDEPAFVVTQVAKPAVGRPSFGSPVSKPACRGHAKPLPNNHPATPFYSARLCRPAPASAPVSPGQTFEILNKSAGATTFVVAQVSKPAVSQAAKPACRGHAKSLPNNPPTPFYSAAPASAPVSPGQTFEFFQLRPQRWPARESSWGRGQLVPAKPFVPRQRPETRSHATTHHTVMPKPVSGIPQGLPAKWAIKLAFNGCFLKLSDRFSYYARELF